MAKAIEQLLVLQACDQEIRRLRREMEDIPLRKQQIESRLSAHKEGSAQAEHALLEAQTRIKHLEGEIEAARALGMSRAQAMLYIILPRAARIGLPAYSNEVILMLKASALASTVTLLELTGMARTIIARTYLPVEIFFAAGMFYLLIAFLLVRAFKLLERWLRVDACQGR